MGSTGYGSNLDDAGSTGGSDLTGGTTRRDDASLDAGTTRSAALGDGGTTGATGTGEVHSGLSVGRDVDTGYSAIAAAGSTADRSTRASTGGSSGEGGAMNRVREVAGQARERVQGMAGDLPGRVNDVAGQARERAGQAMHRAEQVLEDRGVLDRVRENPLPALGIAFGLGFLLAGSGESTGKRGGALESAKHQLKGAIMGGLSAAVAQEGRNLLSMAQGQGNQGGFLGTLMENLKSGGSSGQARHSRPSHQELA